jgi:aminotransferase
MDWTLEAIAERAKSVRSPKFGQIAEVRNLAAGKEDVVDLGYGEPDFITPSHIREAAKKAIDEGFTHYVLPVEGLKELREAISKKLSTDNGIAADPKSEVLVTSGVQAAINVVMLTLVEPGDEVIMPEPYYYSHPLGVILAGGVPVYTPLKEDRGFRIDPDDVKDRVTPKTKAIIYISPNCPTGSVFVKEDLKRIADIAFENKMFIVTDEIYEKLVYDGEKHLSIGSFPEVKDQTISMFGFSKAYAMTGWRIGYLTANSNLVKNFIELHGQITICANSIAQKAALAALTGSQDCVEEMRAEYEERRNIITRGLNRLNVRCQYPKGSFYIYANISELGISGFEFAKRLAAEARVIGYPGTAFTTDKSGPDYIRFAYTKTADGLKEAVERISAVIKKI